MKKIIALMMVVVSLFSIMSISVFAEDVADIVTVTVNDTEFIFNADTTEEFRNNFIAYYFNGATEDEAEIYGLTCTLFGHKMEYETVIAVQHNVYATAPKCVENTYSSEICTRCGYNNYSLVASRVIFCCP